MGDKLEDKVRVKLSHYPILYAFIGGSGIIIFWRGIWHTMDFCMELLGNLGQNAESTGWSYTLWWDGPLSILIGTILLLTVGLFVTSFIGNEIIISGLKKEKKLVEKTELEIQSDFVTDRDIRRAVENIEKQLARIEAKLK